MGEPYKYATYGDVIDAYVEEKRRDEDAVERSPRFYASQFGCCHRRMVLQRAEVPGRPLSIDSMRNLEERSLLHDARLRQLQNRGALIAADSGTPYSKRTAPTRLSEAFPEGFGCRCDGIGHLRCGCGRSYFPMKVHWGKMARLSKQPGMESRAEQSRRQLMRHELEVIEIKTAHPNLMNYATTLPRPHNVLQVRAAAWAVRTLYRITNITPVLIYFAVGSGAKPLEFTCGTGLDDTYEDVEREIASLQMQWMLYKTEEVLPDYKPFSTKSKKEGPNRVLFRVMDWECNDLYCPYFGDVCQPPQTVNEKGEVLEGGNRLGYLEEDGSTTYVQKWLNNVPGYAIVGNAQVIDQPRGKEG